MKKAFTLLFTVACVTGTAFASSIVYGAGDNNSLYTINPATGATTLVGAMGVNIYDIAEFGGKLYGISAASNLYSISTTTGAATDIGSTGQEFNALTFSSTGVLYAAGIDTTDLFTVNTGTGASTKVSGETTQSDYNSAGDLQFVGNTLYLITQTNGNSILDTVNLATGALTKVGTNLGSANVFGLAESGGVLYGFTDNDGSSKVLSINTTTGVGSTVADYGGTGRSAFGFEGTTDNNMVPEPGTMGVMGLGLVGLGAFVRRRRKA
ncbi:MAG: PEP-CTERM sorting domain-containing protein [Bryobacteraceae bacterium]